MPSAIASMTSFRGVVAGLLNHQPEQRQVGRGVDAWLDCVIACR